MSRIINFKAQNVDHISTIVPDAVKHCNYVKGILEASDENEVTVEIPHSDPKIIDFMADFLEKHKDDEEVTDGWEKQKPRALTPEDKEGLQKFVGLELVNLLKAANFIGSQLMLNAVATYVGQVLVTKNEQEVQAYFGVQREFTKEEEEQVKAKYPVPFY